MKAAEAGLEPMRVAEAAKATALRSLRRWLTESAMVDYRPQLDWIIDTRQWELVLDSFYQTIPFGTGGRRGPVGIGTNRINPWTIGASVQGHCEFLHAVLPGRDDLHVVIAYDVRVFRDVNGVYSPELPNPVLGLGSRDLAHAAAEDVVHIPVSVSRKIIGRTSRKTNKNGSEEQRNAENLGETDRDYLDCFG